jgi:hypothetical protein
MCCDVMQTLLLWSCVGPLRQHMHMWWDRLLSTWRSMAQHGAAWRSMAQHGAASCAAGWQMRGSSVMMRYAPCRKPARGSASSKMAACR